jgi:hypothetical protein
MIDIATTLLLLLIMVGVACVAVFLLAHDQVISAIVLLTALHLLKCCMMSFMDSSLRRLHARRENQDRRL